jgi:hypothetical protein
MIVTCALSLAIEGPIGISASAVPYPISELGWASFRAEDFECLGEHVASPSSLSANASSTGS